MAKVTIGKLEEGLVNKTKKYKELTGTSTVELIEGLLTDFFKDSLLTNDFIELENPFYFINVPFLYDGEIMIASLENPIGTFLDEGAFKVASEDVYLVNKVPNNLDSFNKKYNKYCFNNNPDIHKGIYVLHKFENISDNPEEVFVDESILLFDYNEADNTLTIDNLTYSKEEILYRIGAGNKKVYDSIIAEVEGHNNLIFKKGLDPFDPEKITLNYESVLESFEVVEPYKVKVAIDNYLIKEGLSVENGLAELKEDFLKEAEFINPIHMLEMVLNNEL